MRILPRSLSRQVITPLGRIASRKLPLAVATDTTPRPILLKHHARFCPWIPIVSLLLARPASTWSYFAPSLHYPSKPTVPTRNVKAHQSFSTWISTSSLIPGRMPRTKRSRTSPTSVMAKHQEDAVEAPVPTPSPRKRKASTTKESSKAKSPDGKKKKSTAKADSSFPAVTKGRAKKGEAPLLAAKQVELPEAEAEKESTEPKTKNPAKKKKTDHQRITERDPLPKLWDSEASAKANGSYTFRIASWNVAGLRALMKKEPTALADLCREHNLDMLCLQETKLQDVHLDDPKLKLRGCMAEAGYDEYWSCSTVKKGYSGTAVFVKQHGRGKKKLNQRDIGSFFGKKSKAKGDDAAPQSEPAEVVEVSAELVTPSDVSYQIGKRIDNEGRIITMEFPFATITNVYVPNSGQNLERLQYRTKEWDQDFLAFQQKKEKDRGLPVIWLGDLNIAHKAYDIWNDGAPHLPKQAGVTEEERASFTAMLNAGYVDAFRKLHPEAKGHYSYWSQRAGNRPPNKGLRLDYFVCSPELFSEDSPAIVRDSYMIPERLGSDHSPVVLEIELKKQV